MTMIRIERVWNDVDNLKVLDLKDKITDYIFHFENQFMTNFIYFFNEIFKMSLIILFGIKNCLVQSKSESKCEKIKLLFKSCFKKIKYE